MISRRFKSGDRSIASVRSSEHLLLRDVTVGAKQQRSGIDSELALKRPAGLAEPPCLGVIGQTCTSLRALVFQASQVLEVIDHLVDEEGLSADRLGIPSIREIYATR